MKVGHVIRAERVRQGMKQIVLAKGICTPSYLSKIERNLISPSEEVAELLMQRLGMELSAFMKTDSKAELAFINKLKESYRNVITKRDKNFTKQQLEYVVNQHQTFEDHSHYYTYLLIVLRYHLILGNNLEDCKKEIDALNELSEYFGTKHMYLFKLNKALYYYITKNRTKAIEYFEDMLSLTDDIVIEDWEMAELHYMLGVVYTAESRMYNSIEHIRKALGYYRENFSMKRVLECYVLIGITHKQSEKFQEALEAYLKAEQIREEFKLDNDNGIISHNLGSLYSLMDESDKAIHYYQKSIHEKTDDLKGQFITIYCIIIQYSKLKNKELVQEWCKSGISLYFKLNDENFTSYHHHFRIYASLHSDEGLSEKIAKEAIEYFKAIQDYQNIHKYCIALAEWYYCNRKYKLSSIYYKEANRVSYIYRNIKSWEDL